MQKGTQTYSHHLDDPFKCIPEKSAARLATDLSELELAGVVLRDL